MKTAHLLSFILAIALCGCHSYGPFKTPMRHGGPSQENLSADEITALLKKANNGDVQAHQDLGIYFRSFDRDLERAAYHRYMAVALGLEAYRDRIDLITIREARDYAKRVGKTLPPIKI